LFVEVNEAMYYKFHNDILKKKKLDRLHRRSLTFQLHQAGFNREEARKLVYGFDRKKWPKN